MKDKSPVKSPLDSSRKVSSCVSTKKKRLLNNKNYTPVKIMSFALISAMIFAGVALGVIRTTRAKNEAALTNNKGTKANTLPQSSGKTYLPTQRPVESFAPINIAEASRQEALEPRTPSKAEIKAIDAPKDRPVFQGGVPITKEALEQEGKTEAVPASATGTSASPTKTFKGEFLSSTSIPPDTMGAVGITHIVNTTNDRMRIQDRNGVEISRVTLTSFWAGVTIKGAAVAAFDPKVYFDRFNNRFILISSFNSQSVNSGAGFAVSQTGDPTGLWNRYSVAADPTSTAAGGHWIDYPTVGFNKNWIVVNENVFNYGTAGTGYFGTQIYVLDKQAAYNNTLGAISLFEAAFSTCTAPFETKLGCGFTMAPSINEDNTTDTNYLVEDWDSTAGQLRLSKITGTASAPVLTVGTQFPQSTNSWRFDAVRVITAGTQSGGYAPQRQQSANLISGTRIMTNDSRIQNAVLRNGSLYATHTVMLASTPTAAGTTVGGANRDNHSGVQWWEIDPTIETGLSTLPIQRGRIEDPTADNCHNGSGATVTTAPCSNSIQSQHGTFLAFPNISVNQNDDILLGFTQFSPFTYPSGAYAIHLSTDAANTMRDPVVYRPGQSNYNIGSGSGATRQNRWGDYSAAQTDPLDDTTFWTVQQYAGTNRNDFLAPSYAGPWETWWAQVNPATTAPSTSGSLIISEFRLRGPQGVRDEYVELYNPGNTPVIVNTTDNSDGWTLAFSTNGTAVTAVAVIPNGTVIPARGHFLIADNPDNTAGGTSALTYSLNGHAGLTNPASQVRGADSDTGWAFDLADNGGLAIFKTANTANFNATTLMDSAGFAVIAAGLFKEGTGIPTISATTPTGQMAFVRKLTTGTPLDTGANESDFQFVDTALEVLTVTPYLGAAGPENLSSPIKDTAVTINDSLVDSGCAATAFNPASPTACAFERNTTAVTNGALGTLSIRRQFTNNTGQPITRLRFRVADVTGPTNQPVGTADVRVLTSPTVTGNLSGGGTTTIQGLTLEEPPTQANGGGINSSLNASTVSLSAPLANGASINVQFQLGVQTNGTFNFCVMSESLPMGGSSMVCYSGNADGTNLGPTITTTGTLVDFGSVNVGSFSPPQSYTVSAINLTGNLIINAPTDFQVSTSMSSGFGSSVTLTPTSGTVPTTTIYVRFAPTSAGPKSGNVTNASPGAFTQNVAVSGTGVAVCSSSITVMNNADSGAGSLRQAVTDVCAGGTINFDTAGVFATPQTITLTSGEIVIGKNLTITGTGASALTVSGNNSSRIFSVSIGFTVNISGLTLTGGNGGGAASNGVGGAILNSGGTLNLTSSVITGNSSTSSGGGLNNLSGTSTVTNCIVSGNTAGTFGGGIRASSGTLNVINSTISGNTANNGSGNAGGGIDSGGTLNVTNSTISGNSVPSGTNAGGGIWVSNTATITNSTITNNSVPVGTNNAGGIIRTSGTTTVRNTIVAANQNNTNVPDVSNGVGGGVFVSSGYNLIGNVGTVTNFNQTGDQTGTGASPLDPKLAPLANNGGATLTHKLRANSPALDKGNSFALTTDQRGAGFIRPVDLASITNASGGDGSDIGAYEAQTSPNKVPLDFDGDGKSDYAVIQGIFPRANGVRDGRVKDVRLSGDLLADDNQRFWKHGYNKLLHLRAGRGFLKLSKDVQAAQARWEKEQSANSPTIEGAGSLNWLIRKSSDGTTLNYSLGTNTDVFVPADYDGDGKTDAAVWNPVTGFTVIQSSTLSPVTYPLGVGNTNADPTVIGDYDGDGFDDPAIYDSTTGIWSWLGGATHATADSATWFSGGIPAPGDYNGDGKMDFGVQIPPGSAPDSAKFRIAFNDGSVGPAADISISYGLAVYAIVPGDYDGDGKTDIGQANLAGTNIVWRYLTSSSNYTVQVKRTFGVVATDRTVQGDYDGDGKIDLAVYRRGSSPDDGVFIVFQSSTSTATSPFDWGDVDDYPVGFFNSH